MCGELVVDSSYLEMQGSDLQEVLEQTKSDVSSKALALENAEGENLFDDENGIVSFQAELPVPLQDAMASFIERYPNWDQYRLIQAALAGFLVQNGVESRPITRLYIGNMFGCQSFS